MRRIATSIRDVNTWDVLNWTEEEFRCVWRITCIVNHDEKIVLEKTIVFNLLGNLNSQFLDTAEKKRVLDYLTPSVSYMLSALSL